MIQPDNSITEPVESVKIPPFKLRVDNSEWSFSGFEVSTKVCGESRCSFSGGQVMHIMEGNMLTLSDQAALLWLAIEKIKGYDISDVPDEAVEGALRIFYNNLYMTLTASNPGASFQNFFGEWVYDVVDFKGAKQSFSEGYVAVKWIKRPKATKKGKEKFCYEVGDNSELVQTVLPKYAGVAVKTCDGHLDPRTGAPFEVDRTQKYGDTEFLRRLGKRIINRAYGTPEDSVLDELIFCYKGRLNPVLEQALTEEKISLEDLRLEEFIDLWKPSYGFSHNFQDKPLPLADTMVVMRGLDGISSLFIVSLGLDIPNCGIQMRPTKPYSRSL